MKSKLVPAKEKAFIRLIDDQSPIVHGALLKEFRALQQEGIRFLNAVSHKNKQLAPHAKVFLKELLGEDTVSEFITFIRGMDYDLEQGCVLMERTINPGLELAEITVFLDAVSARCRELIVYPSSIRERCRVINRVLFHECGFCCNPDYDTNPNNVFLSKTIERRQGFAISLSILYILVAKRLDIRLELIDIPGYIMVGCFLEKQPFYVDLQSRGAFRVADELYAILVSQNMDPNVSRFGPSNTGEIISLACQQLVEQYALDNQAQRVDLFARFVDEFEHAHYRHVIP